MPNSRSHTPQVPLAIVGIGCRFPGGAHDAEAFWQMLAEGRSGIGEVPDDRWDADRYFHPDTSVPEKMHTRWGGFVTNLDKFDPAFFGISPREAQRMDPQQRWLLEVAWEALEDAGMAPSDLRGSRTGVFVGISSSDYGGVQMAGLSDVDVHTNSGITSSIASNRISYLFDFKGPSLSVDTACSSALVAVHLACRSLWSGESNLVLAGGVNALITPDSSVGFSKATMLSPSGQCFAFDARANGYVRGEGAGLIAIRRLDDALASGDRIYALIRSTVINQDGNTSSMTVPGEESQAAMLDEAYAIAGFDPSRVRYMEAHGTGTPVGDPIETRALGRVLARHRPDSPEHRCVIGSVKTNIGHLESGSGIAGLIKAALVLHKKSIPPNLNFAEPNPNIPFEALKLRVPVALEAITRPDGMPAVSAVNSFGFGGANAHVVMEEAPDQSAPLAADTTKSARPFVLPISARGPIPLRNRVRQMRELLRDESISLSALCHTAGAHAEHHDDRVVAIGQDRAELRQNLRTWLSNLPGEGAFLAGKPLPGSPAPIFVFTGQGAQWWGMGQQLLESEPLFRRTLEKIDALLKPLAGWSLLEEMKRDAASSRIDRTDIAQPAIFALQVGLAELWKSWGIIPAKVVGHSVGEVAAAYVAGIYSMEDAVSVIFHRSLLQNTTGGHGRMAAVGLSPAVARERLRGLEDKVQVAVINSPSMITLAGDTAALEGIVKQAEADGVFVRWLRIDYAFHTHQMEPIREPLLKALADIKPLPATVPFYSTVTGDLVDGTTLDAAYWWRNVREPVLFAPAMAALIQGGESLFLELGPHPALRSSITECLSEQGTTGLALHSLKRETAESRQLMENIAALHIAGVKIDWQSLNQCGNSDRVHLPSYPWNRDRFWLESERSHSHRLEKVTHPLLGIRQPGPDPVWEFLLHPAEFDYLEDHRFWDGIVFPAAGYAEMGLALARTLYPNEPTWSVEELETTRALFIDAKHPPRVRVVFREEAKSFEIFSAPDNSAAKWELHARGILRKLAAPSQASVSFAEIQKHLPEHFTHERYYEDYSKAGYQFGPRFQQVENVWRRDLESLVEIHVPASLGEDFAARYHFHPAVLDACFHALKGAQVIPPGSKPRDNFWLPAAIARVRLIAKSLPSRLFAHALVKINDRETVLADIFVYDPDGNPIGEILGFRVDRVEQKDENAESVENSIFQFRWETRRLHGSRTALPLTFSATSEIVQHVAEQTPAIFEHFQLGPYLKNYTPRSRQLVGHFIVNAFLQLGWKPRVGDTFSFTDFVQSLGIITDHHRLVRAQLSALSEDGILEPVGEGWRVLRAPEKTDAVAELAALQAAWPSCEAELNLYALTGPNLADVLSGEVDPLEILFPGGKAEALERFYREGADFLPNNAVLRETIAAALKGLPERRALRILEIGAGTGSLTKVVLPILPAERSEYLFSDNGAAFLSDGRKIFADCPFIDFALFDIEKDPAGQNIVPGSYDLILATNVIHATKDLANTLSNIKQCLAPGGMLVFLEVTTQRAELDMIFGLLKGWWQFTDTELRGNSALMPPEKWRDLLRATGFTDIDFLTAVPKSEGNLQAGQTVFCAHLPGAPVVQQPLGTKVHLIGSHPHLAAALETSGASLHSTAMDADIILHAATLAEPESLLAAQDHGVLELHRLSREIAALPEDAPRPHVIVLTRGTQFASPDEVPTFAALAASPVIGLLRVARSELSEALWKHIDLDPAADENEIDDILAEVFLPDDGEREVAYRATLRHVCRLHPIRIDDLPGLKRNAISPHGKIPYRLQISTPGVLTNLSLNETSRRTPGPDEIEVEVKAGGINFRDVMKALGMYPGNPIDLRWFGDDFSGTILRVGENVTDLQPGDAVTGMAPYCFRSHVTVNRAMVFRKPAHLAHTQAATLPTVFLTARYALVELARLQPGEKVLIHAGTGGVGQAAIQVARDLGLEIFATAGSPEKRKLLHEMGVHHVMDSRSLAFADEIMEITKGTGVDAVLNSLAGDFIPKSFSVLATFGRFLEIGKIDVYGNRKLGLATLKDNISYFVIDLAQHLEKRPAYVAGLLEDIRKKLEARAYTALPNETFPVTDVINAFRHMAQGKHIGKNVLDFDLPEIPIGPNTEPKEMFRADASYLITGGAGGFGFEVAKWMLSHGAKHLVLMSRSGPRDAEIIAEIETLRSQGATITCALGDVSRLDDVSRVIADIAATPHPLRGLIHGAMVLDDDFLAALDTERFNKVLHPKVLGAWNLHQATAGCDLDHFISFSSFSAVIGAVKQANYNAGNIFLDALACYRRARGLPALTINWGALSGAGFVERNAKTAQYLDALGLKAFSMADTQQVLERLLPRDAPNIAASRIDWTQMFKLSPALAANPTFTPVASTNSEGQDSSSIRPRLLAASADERARLLEDFLATQVAGVFGTESSRIDRNAPLNTLGLDSLMAIELMNRIESGLGLNLPMSAVLNGPSVVQLAKPILDQLEKSCEGSGDVAKSESTSSKRTGSAPDQFPLSEGQRALWFLHQLAPETPAYNLVFSAKITPLVNIEVMERAFASLYVRHPMLDVVFSSENGTPVQTLRKGGSIDFREHDATHLSDQDVKALLVHHANQPFVLAEGPMARLELFRTSENAHVVLLSLHHIISDAWSVSLLMKDLIESYFSMLAGRTPDYAPLDVRYSDFVAWEEKELRGSRGEAHRGYWLRTLEGAPTSIDLPTDFPRPALQSFAGAHLGFKLEPELTAKVLALAKSRNTTLYATLLAAFNTLMHRISGQRDIVIGSPMAGRSRPEWRDVIGYFVNPVPIRSRLTDDPTFTSFMESCSRQAREAVEHQDYPLLRIIDDLKLQRDPSRSPLFQVAFGMERIPGIDTEGIAAFLIGQAGHRFEIGEMVVESIDLALRQAQFDLALVVEEAGEQIYGSWQYNRDLFDAATIARFSTLFRCLLEDITARPEARLSTLRLMDDASLANQIRAHHAVDVQAIEEKSVVRLIREQASQTPAAPALTHGQQVLTYSELITRSNGLAALLQAEGIKPGESVGLLASRSPNMVVGLLGILSSGGAYVPMDPEYPRVRLQQMLEDAQPRFVIGDRALAATLPTGPWKFIALEDIRPAALTMAFAEPHPDAPAYTIYTSGSTGVPKGVVIPHRALTNFLTSMRRTPGIARTDTLLAVTTISFDIAALEIFLPLTSGAHLILADREDARDGQRLGQLLSQHDVTIMQATPAGWRLLLESGWQGKSNLRILCGGEAMPRALANTLLDKAREVWNLYGPTETTIWSTCCRIEKSQGPVSIGTAIDHTSLFIVDENLAPVPDGLSGELCIGGRGLALGYHNRPELTADRFVQLALPDGSHQRVYRTGDLARWRTDGSLECLGRTDFQIKLRGVRIELGEIESALASHPLVHQVVVSKRTDLPGGEALVAYIVPQQNAKEPQTADLKAHLLDKLPEAMRPAHYHFMPALPLTPNGKIDRMRLPAPTLSTAPAPAEPRSATEKQIHSIFATAFHPRAVSIRDNFFDLGGDSLLAVKIVHQLTQARGATVPVAAFLQHPTIEDLARHLDLTSAEKPAPVSSNGHAPPQRDLRIEFTPDSDQPVRIDAAALACIPDSLAELSGMTRQGVSDFWFGNGARLTNIYETAHGRIGLVMLPFFESDLFAANGKLKESTLAALRLASAAGARHVSLTGLIPSATDHGNDVRLWVNGDTSLPSVTTGDATRAATVVLAVEGILEKSDRSMQDEHLALVGLSSIGRGTLSLLLAVLPHPRAISLCAFHNESGRLETVREELRAEGFMGEIHLLSAQQKLPQAGYEATLMVSATSVGEAIDIDLLQPGSLLVDYSFPNAFNHAKALRRLESQHDILFTTGGHLRLDQEIGETMYLPADAAALLEALPQNELHALSPRGTHEITGCVLASLVSGMTPEVRETLGPVQLKDCLAHYHHLKTLPARPAALQVDGNILDERLVLRFLEGSAQAAAPV